VRGALSRLLLQHLLVDAAAFRHQREIELTLNRVAGGADGRQQAVQRLAPVLDVTEPPFAVEQLNLPLHHIHRVSKNRFQGSDTAPPHQ
jgi:hypothetical protein